MARIGKQLSFEDLKVWKKSRELVKDVFAITRSVANRSFQDQLQRAAISVMNNIAEGHESGSPKLFIRYLRTAKASCGEVRSMLYAAYDLKYLTFGKFRATIDKATEISRMTAGLIRSLQRKT